MRSRPFALILIMAFLLVLSQDRGCRADGPAAPAATFPMKAGVGSFVFTDDKGNAAKPLTIYYYCPAQLKPTTPIIFIMHGVNRDARRYRDEWLPYAQQYGFILVCPEFSQANYPGEAYAWGNMFDAQNNPIPEAQWAFSAIEHLFDTVKELTQNTSEKYYIYGHSAGGQFVHRFVMFLPQARCARAVAANPGVYTLPVFNGHKYPYGLRDSGMTEAKLKFCFGQNLLILLGSADTDANDPDLSKTPRAEEQGATRFARGQNFYQACQTAATQLSATLNWKWQVVPGAQHSDKQMANAAMQAFLGK